MALPDPRFIESPSLENIFLNKDTGALLSAGTVKFFSDVARTVLKPIYQQVRLPNNTYTFVALNNPVTLTSIGTYGDNSGNDINVYLYPFTGLPTDATQGAIELYYIEVYSSAGVLQFTREAWPPGVQEPSGANTFTNSENIIENPQFVEVNFTTNPATSTYVYNVSGAGTVSNVAPDWDIVSFGSGTVTVDQERINTLAPSNPPFALKIGGTGITSLVLRQRITNSPRIMGTGFISGSLVAKTFTGAAANLTMDYIASNGYTVNLVNKSTSADGNYNTLINDTASAVNTTNTSAPPGYVDIAITIPIGATVGITSVQIVSTQNIDSSSEFIQQSVPRQIDHLFHDYEIPLKFKPIPSFLTGWDFPLNPAQFGSTFTMNATPAYGWDQTICASFANNLNCVRDTTTGGLLIQSTAATQAFYIQQYLSGAQAKKMLDTSLSVNISGYASISPSNVTVRAYLCRGSSAAIFPVLPLNMGIIDATGNFTVTGASWTLVPRGEFGTAVATLPFGTAGSFNASMDIPFSYWQITDGTQISDTDKFAIFVTFNVPTINTSIVIQSVSLIPGNIATRPAPQTLDEVLRECQYYYEMTYNGYGAANPAGSVTTINAYSQEQFASASGVAVATYAKQFSINYTVQKRVAPTLSFYSEAGTLANVSQYAYVVGVNLAGSPADAVLATSWDVLAAGTKITTYVSKNNVATLSIPTGGTSRPEAFIRFHYLSDARLGVV